MNIAKPSQINFMLNKRVTVLMFGGKEFSGILLSIDNVGNICMAKSHEQLHNLEGQRTSKTRELGNMIIKGASIQSIYETDSCDDMSCAPKG